jgi:hypothetical protein
MYNFSMNLSDKTELELLKKLKSYKNMEIWLQARVKDAIIEKFGENALLSDIENDLNSGSMGGGGRIDWIAIQTNHKAIEKEKKEVLE